MIHNSTSESITQQKELNKKIAISNQNRDKSIARSEKSNACDYSLSTEHEIRCFFNEVSINSPIGALLITMLLTGRSVDTLLNNTDAFKVASSESKYQGFLFFEVNREYPCSHLNLNKREANKNGLVSIPRELTVFLSKILCVESLSDDYIDKLKEKMRQILSNINKKHNTRLTLSKICRPFNAYCTHRGISEIFAGIIAGKGLSEHSGNYYTGYINGQVLEILQQFAKYLESLAEKSLFTFPTVSSYLSCGSSRVPEKNLVTEYFYSLEKLSKDAKNSGELIVLHNIFTAYTVGILQIATCHRPENHAFGTLSNFDLISGDVFISDKETGDNHKRIISVVETALIQVRNYLNHLEKLRDISTYLYPAVSCGVSDILNSKENLFCYIKKDSFQFEKPLDYPEEMADIDLPGVSNYYRHLLRTHFEQQKLPTDLIDCFMGHENKRDHSKGRFSSLENKHFELITDSIDKLFAELRITPFISPIEEW